MQKEKKKKKEKTPSVVGGMNYKICVNVQGAVLLKQCEMRSIYTAVTFTHPTNKV